MHGLHDRLISGLTRDGGELGEAAKLMWDLSVANRAGAEGRSWFKASYSAFITSPLFFDFGHPGVYRECIRLRNLFSDPSQLLERRLAAVEAYGRLFPKFDLDKSVARAESRMARNALSDFLAEGKFERGSRPYMTVNGAWLDIEQGTFIWNSGKRVGLRAGNEDWEGSY
ncbi:MAG TPA: hypothetical protein VJP40_09010, partial [bacterium]|nr:hypothetical protein [bacterium]